MERKFVHNSNLTPLARTLRKNMTKEERHLWYDYLRAYPIRILKQKIIDNFIVDFYCSKAKLAIEIDGKQHYIREFFEAEKIRTEKIEQYEL